MFRPEGYSGPIMIEVDRIDQRPASEVRAASDGARIEIYRECLDDLPPILVVADADDRHWCADGFHRLAGYRLTGKTKVPCLVKGGTYIDAYKDACHANDAHGIPTTNADKRRRVELALTHPVMSKWSTRAIADACGVSHDTVRRLDLRCQVDDSSTLIGKDGKQYPAKPKPKAPRNEPFTCGDCGEEFSSEVWHCNQCDQHFGKDVHSCPNCVHSSEPAADPGVIVEPEAAEAKRAINEAFEPKEVETPAPFDRTAAFRVVRAFLRDEVDHWPAEDRHSFAFKLRALADEYCREFGVTIEEVNRGA